ncbi:Hypothetical predicted protein [Marmota monax]|uniref:Xyloside xylosyltransferase 1 n=1 Tax=Marmota monax TaxID=9995 RepID=A0A5E4DBK0_MARMO|nr:hypothetical protein GHT09_014182 [Marmota monax]VTJ91654.1 Hypothetical predicted protein [Marmota monax]
MFCPPPSASGSPPEPSRSPFDHSFCRQGRCEEAAGLGWRLAGAQGCGWPACPQFGEGLKAISTLSVGDGALSEATGPAVIRPCPCPAPWLHVPLAAVTSHPHLLSFAPCQEALTCLTLPKEPGPRAGPAPPSSGSSGREERRGTSALDLENGPAAGALGRALFDFHQALHVTTQILSCHWLEYPCKRQRGVCRLGSRHTFWQFRHENPTTRVGGPPPDGLPGFNSGVMLLSLEAMRQSPLYSRLLEPAHVQQLASKYHFRGHLGDQDFFTMIGMEHPELFHVLDCTWNRQLCTWWRDHGYSDVFDAYFRCEGHVKIYHGNCNTPIPDD